MKDDIPHNLPFLLHQPVFLIVAPSLSSERVQKTVVEIVVDEKDREYAVLTSRLSKAWSKLRNIQVLCLVSIDVPWIKPYSEIIFQPFSL